jgi:hypothetical protein
MKNITVKYGVDSITKQVEDDFTFGDLQDSDAFKAALGFGDRTKALVDGIEQDRATVIPANATVRPPAPPVKARLPQPEAGFPFIYHGNHRNHPP